MSNDSIFIFLCFNPANINVTSDYDMKGDVKIIKMN